MEQFLCALQHLPGAGVGLVAVSHGVAGLFNRLASAVGQLGVTGCAAKEHVETRLRWERRPAALWGARGLTGELGAGALDQHGEALTENIGLSSERALELFQA